jgi:hypothetical protein
VTLNPGRQLLGAGPSKRWPLGSFVSWVLWLNRQDRRGVATSVLGSMNNRRGSLRTSRQFSRMARGNGLGAALEDVGDSLCPSRETTVGYGRWSPSMRVLHCATHSCALASTPCAWRCARWASLMREHAGTAFAPPARRLTKHSLLYWPSSSSSSSESYDAAS